MSIKTKPWTNGNLWPGLMNEVFLYMLLRWHQVALWEVGKLNRYCFWRTIASSAHLCKYKVLILGWRKRVGYSFKVTVHFMILPYLSLGVWVLTYAFSRTYLTFVSTSLYALYESHGPNCIYMHLLNFEPVYIEPMFQLALCLVFLFYGVVHYY